MTRDKDVLTKTNNVHPIGPSKRYRKWQKQQRLAEQQRLADLQFNLDDMRREFADRMREILASIKEPSKLQTLSQMTRISQRQLSEWTSDRHLNWPSVGNLIRLSIGTGKSIDWLVTGRNR